MSRFPTGFPQFDQPTVITRIPQLLLPYEGIITLDTTNEYKSLWDCRDERYGQQPQIAEAVWLEAFKDNVTDLFLGSVYIDYNDQRGLRIMPGERPPPIGPLDLDTWYIIGQAGKKLRVSYWPANPAVFGDDRGRVFT